MGKQASAPSLSKLRIKPRSQDQDACNTSRQPFSKERMAQGPWTMLLATLLLAEPSACGLADARYILKKPLSGPYSFDAPAVTIPNAYAAPMDRYVSDILAQVTYLL